MNAAVGLTAGLGLDGDRCIRVIPRHYGQHLPPGQHLPIMDSTPGAVEEREVRILM